MGSSSLWGRGLEARRRGLRNGATLYLTYTSKTMQCAVCKVVTQIHKFITVFVKISNRPYLIRWPIPLSKLPLIALQKSPIIRILDIIFPVDVLASEDSWCVNLPQSQARQGMQRAIRELEKHIFPMQFCIQLSAGP